MADKITQLEDSIPFEAEEPGNGLLSSIIFAFPQTGSIPGWWTQARDRWLREEWINHDSLKLAVKTFVNKVNSIPMRIVARDSRISTHQMDAQMMQNAIMHQSGLFRGFKTEIKKAVIDYLTQDNGCFIWIMGPGEQTLIGAATGLYHLDAYRCERTSNPMFPVKYYDWDGKIYNLHYTRVIFFSQDTSPIAEYNGVGVCSVSACLDARQELSDISTHSAEKLGSRPAKQILYVKKGATIQQLIDATKKAESKMDNAGLTTYSYTTLLAPKNAQQELDLGSIDLNSTPDGFDRRDVTIIDKADIAAAFGLSLSDMNVSYGVAGQNGQEDMAERTDRGKGPNSFIEELEIQINEKVLPRHLMVKFDNIDDEQDELQARIWDLRSLARDRDMSSGVTSTRVERQRMLRLGEIEEEEFEYQELSDGRLPDGTSVLSLFYNPIFSDLLSLGVPMPTFISQNDAQDMVNRLEAAKVTTWQFLQGTRSRPAVMRGRASLSAIETLQAEYKEVLEMEMAMVESAEEVITEEVV